MSRTQEIVRKLEELVHAKINELKNNLAAEVEAAKNDLLKGYGVLSQYQEFKKNEATIEALKERNNDLEKAIMAPLGIDHSYHWESEMERLAWKRIPQIERAVALHDRIEFEVLLASSGKELAGLFNRLFEEIKNL